MLTKPYFGKLFFEADGGNSGGNSNGSESDSGTDAQPGGQQGEPAFKAITSESELAAWKGTTRKAILDEVRADLAREQADKDAAAEQKRKDDEAIRRGEFEEVQKGLESKATAADERAKSAETDRDAAYQLLEAQAETLKAELPKEVLDGFPESGSPVERITWLKDRQAVFEAAKAAAGVAATNVTRLPVTPKGTNHNAKDAAYEQMKGRVSI